jgi:hypothetical protein
MSQSNIRLSDTRERRVTQKWNLKLGARSSLHERR